MNRRSFLKAAVAIPAAPYARIPAALAAVPMTATEIYMRTDAIAYQLMLMGREIKKDIEWALMADRNPL